VQQAAFLYHFVATQTIITPLVLLLILHTKPQTFNESHYWNKLACHSTRSK